jgi:carboxymethylenebutenolidase
VTTQEIFRTVPLAIAGEASSARALIVIQEAFGVNDHIRDVVAGFAAEGYFVVAPELFHRVGSPEVPYDNFPEAMSAMGTLNASDITSDLQVTASFLDEAGFHAPSVGIVGYCMGGTVSFYAATLGIVAASVSFYGGGIDSGRFGFPSLLDLAPHLQSDWLGLYGDLDKGIPVEQVEALREATAATTHDTEIVRYHDAEHGFSCDARPGVFHATAAADARQRTLDFFAQHLRDK